MNTPETEAPSWGAASIAALRAKLTDAFPCIYAATAQLTIALAETATDVVDLERIKLGLLAWIGRTRDAAPKDAARMVFVVILAPGSQPKPEADYTLETWGILRYLRDHDPWPWPAAVPTNPAHPLWSFCFGGEPIFINASSPAHVRRHSRDLGPGLVLVIQTRAGIDLLVPPGSAGDEIRRHIRARTHAFDDAPALPMFGPSGRVNDRDWKIICLPDDAGPIPVRCPLAPR